MVLHTHASMGAGHEITARFWQDLTPADLHWTFSDTGWAKAAWGKLFGQWRMGAAVFLWDQRGKLDPELCLRVLRALGRDHLLRAARRSSAPSCSSTSAPFDLARVRHMRLGRRAAQPRGHPRLARGDRHDDLRRLRPDRDRQPRRPTSPASTVRPGSMGKPTPGFDVRRRRATTACALGPGEEGNIALATEPERPVGLLQEYWRDAGRQRRGRSTTTGTSPATAPRRTRTATSGSSAAPTT